jgi:hypothetical protein
MLMDDVGALCWRLGRKLIVSTAQTEQAKHLTQVPITRPMPPESR